MFPIFVADRPASLDILSNLTDFTGKFGILSHAFTTDNFKKKFRDFPVTNLKIGDSGIYQGKNISYEELFNEYEKMGVSHGVIKDFYKQPDKTLKSAKEAITLYLKGKEEGKYTFQLLGVAQGDTVAQYFKSYEDQKELGFEMVAIGGLLYKIENHKRMVVLSSQTFLENVLSAIRTSYPNDDLFPLGVFNRKRIATLNSFDIWGADYKGWIFQYDIEESHKKGNRYEQVRSYLRKEILNPKVIDHSKVDPGKVSVNNGSRKKRLLIMSCSKSKKTDKGKAINVYDGPAYKIIRNYNRRYRDVDIKIISAKYALIDKNDRIEPYDYKMDGVTSEVYRRVLNKNLKSLIENYDDIFVFGGKLYQNVMPQDATFRHSDGKIGKQLHQLNRWLNKQEKLNYFERL